MKYIKIILILGLSYYTNFLLANEYLCPPVPFKYSIGQSTSDHWYIWVEDEGYNFINKTYYKVFNHSLLVTYWGGFPTGVLNSLFKKSEKYIGCCVLKNKNKIKLCAYRNVKENNCKPNIRGPGPDGFICTDKNETR